MNLLRLSRLSLSALAVVSIVPFDLGPSNAQSIEQESARPNSIATRNDDADLAFLTWAKRALVPLDQRGAGQSWNDLEPLGKAIGDARFVALGDNAACGAQTMRLRNRLFEYLVKEKGFTAIAIESGLVEAREIGEFVRGKSGNLKSVVSSGIGQNADDLPEEAELVQWMQTYNTTAGHKRKVNFYGFDIPGRGILQNSMPTNSATVAALKYLERIDPKAAAVFRDRLDHALPRYPSLDDFFSGEVYSTLSSDRRDAISGTIHDLADTLSRNELLYEDISGVEDYQWAYQSAVAALEDDQLFRQTPLAAAEVKKGDYRFSKDSNKIRDRAMFDNIEWIMRREGRDGKLLIFSDNVHLAKQPVVRGLSGSEKVEWVPFGAYLYRRYGRQYFSIGSTIGSGPIKGGLPGCKIAQYETPPKESIDSVLARLNTSSFFLDIRSASLAARWLAEKRHVGPNGGFGLYDVAVDQAFDALVFFDTVSPAHRDGIDSGGLK